MICYLLLQYSIRQLRWSIATTTLELVKPLLNPLHGLRERSDILSQQLEGVQDFGERISWRRLDDRRSRRHPGNISAGHSTNLLYKSSLWRLSELPSVQSSLTAGSWSSW